jgi:hypothetical protein
MHLSVIVHIETLKQKEPTITIYVPFCRPGGGGGRRGCFGVTFQGVSMPNEPRKEEGEKTGEE